MTVPVEIPFTTITTDGATTSFVIPFSWTETADIQAEVTVDGEVVSAPFSVVGTSGNSQVVFNTAPAIGIGTIWRETPIEQDQSSPFASGGAFPNQALALGLDYLTRILAEISLAQQSALSLPLGTAATPFDAAIRANTLIGFGSLGQLLLYPISTSVNALPQMQIINSAGAEMVADMAYGLKTGVGNLTPVLPLLADLATGTTIEIQDVDFAAFTNNQVIRASGSDTIVYQDQAGASTFTMNENGVCLRFVSNGTYWRVIYYGA